MASESELGARLAEAEMRAYLLRVQVEALKTYCSALADIATVAMLKHELVTRGLDPLVLNYLLHGGKR